MRDILRALEIEAADDWAGKLVLSILVVLALWALRRVLVAAVDHREAEASQRYRWRKGTGHAASVLALFLLGFIWFEQFKSISTFLGLVSAGLAIALKDLVTAIAGWMFIVLRRPFDVGDRIEIKNHRGDVIDVRIFKFTLMEIGNWVAADQSTGRIVHLPNSLVLSEVLVNYTRGFSYIWNEIPVLVTFESDWRKGKKMLLEIVDEVTGAFTLEAQEAVRRASHRYLLHFSHLTPIVYTSIADSGVLLTARHICPPRQRRGVVHSISEALLARLAETPDVDLAYPTHRMYRNEIEGKGPLRPEGFAVPPPSSEPPPEEG